MNKAPLTASLESTGYECEDGMERWTYSVAAGPAGAPDRMVEGVLTSDGRGSIEVEKIDRNGLGVPDDLAGRMLAVVYRGLCGDMLDSDCNTAQYVTPDCTKWFRSRLYATDASRLLRAIARYARVTADFQSTLLVSQ